MWLLVSVLTPLAGLLLLLHNVAAQTSPPKITLAPKSMKVAEEGVASFFCKASGNPAPSFHWERKGKRLNDRRSRYEIIDMPHMSVLRIKSVRAKRENDITFTCVADNGLGEARANATLHVYKKDESGVEIPTGYPRIALHPKLKSVEKGLSTVMQCEATGTPEPDIMWLKDMVPVDLSDPRLELLDNGFLQIQNAQESDEATYECVAENSAGVAYSYPAMMYVKVRRVPPRFSVEPEDLKVMPGSDVNLTCVAVGSPMPYVKWRQGAYDLTDEDEIPIGKNVLQLKDVKESMNYTCEASSDLGNIERVVQVIVEAPGTPPKNVRARAASSTTIVVSWAEPDIPNGVIQGYRVYYTLKPEEPVFFWETQEVKNDNRLTTISGLVPNETYTISILAYSSIGPGPMSHPIQVLTTQGAGYQVPYQPLNLHAEPISPNEILVKWDEPQEADTITSYELYYNDSHTRQNVRVSIHPPVNNYRLEDLTPDTVYHIQVSAKSRRGEGPRTPTIQAKTHQFMPGEPRRVKVEAINSTGIFVEWDEPKDTNGKIRGYQVFYIKVNSNDEPIPGQMERYHDTFSGDLREAVITGLDPDTRYLIQVAAYTRKGDGNRSKSRIITTKGAVPTPPRNLHVNLVQEEPPSVKVTWQRPKETYGPLEKYKIIWGPRGESYEEKIMSSEIYSFVTYTLDRGTTYEFRVSARNDVDYGERAVATIKTPDGAPSGAPQNFTATGLTETSVRLTWDLPARKLRNGDIVMYQITYHKLADAINEEDLNITDTFVDIVGLEMNTDYIFKIKAYTSRGAGPWSNRLHFRTFGRIAVHHDVTCGQTDMSFSISTIGLDMGSENVTLSDPRCHVHQSEHKLLGRTPLNACGTSVRFTNDTIIFSNFLIIPPKDNDNENDDDDDSDNTTSVSNIERVIPIECHYNRVSELRLSYLPLMRHILFTETGVGRFQFQIEQFRDASFARKVSPSAYPLKVTSSDDIYLQVSLGESALEGEERYGMEVQTCVASPSSSMMAMHNDSSEELIRNSCPAKEDVEVIDSEQHSSDGSGKQNASGPHHHFRFSFKPNVLSGSSSDSSSSGKASSSSMGLVYIHCRVRLCSAPSCPRPSSECAPLRPSRSEGGGNRVKRAVTEPLGGNEWESTGHHLSTGPLFVTVFDTTDAPRSTEAPLYSPLVIILGSLAGLATIVAIGVIVAWMLTHKGQGRDEVTAS